ncbi:MAG: WD40 repeat domain-containing protein [Bacteroidetes bacterium]|nr:WD40 repeat domain-containing protein [Bacteroidota bacterium]
MKPRIILLLLCACVAGRADAQLRVTYPNGGESFKAGSKITIQWAGVAAADVVTLEFSSDNGSTWSTITTAATGLTYTWVGIPNSPSTTCLIRASRSVTVTPGTLLLFGGNGIMNASFSSDGNQVISAGSDGNVYVWDSHSATLTRTYPTESGVGVPGSQALNWWAEFSPDMKTFVTASPSTDVKPFGNMIRIWDVSSGSKLKEWHLTSLPDSSHTNAMSRFSPDGTRIATTGQDSIYVFDIASGSLVTRLSGFARSYAFGSVYGIPTSLDWKFDGTQIIGAEGIRQDSLPSYVIANAALGDTIKTFKLDTKLPFFSENRMIHYSPDGSKFVVSSDDTAVRVWDIASGAILWRIQPGLRGSVDAVFSHDGKTVVTVGYDSLGSNSYNVKLWDAATGAFIRWVGSVGFASKTIEFSPDDARILVSGNAANTIFQNPVGGIESDVSDAPFTINPNTGGNVVVYTPDRGGRVNDLIDVPVLIDDPGSAIAGGATHVSFSLAFNATMLGPVGSTPAGSVAAGTRVMNFNLPIVATDTVLTTLHFKVALGNDSQTTMAVISPATDAPAVTATNADGVFKLLDLCYAAGTRLLNPNGTVSMNVVQNPATDDIVADLSLIEDGRTTLTLCDPLGRTVAVLLNADVRHGTRRLRLSGSSLSSGRYYLVLQTPNNQIVTQVEVQR